MYTVLYTVLYWTSTLLYNNILGVDWVYFKPDRNSFISGMLNWILLINTNYKGQIRIRQKGLDPTGSWNPNNIFPVYILYTVPSNLWDKFFRAVHSNTSLGHQTGIVSTSPYLGLAPQWNLKIMSLWTPTYLQCIISLTWGNKINARTSAELSQNAKYIVISVNAMCLCCVWGGGMDGRGIISGKRGDFDFWPTVDLCSL